MRDARAIREITDALRVLKDKAGQAGSTKLRTFIGTLIPVAIAEAEDAEREAPTRPIRSGRPAGRASGS